MNSATGRSRRLATAARVTALARELTAERGLSGFTVEEVCERAGISRRTFFNYFAAKDDAVLGLSVLGDDDAAEARFLAGGDPASDHLSPTLLDELARLTAERWTRAGTTPETFCLMRAVFEREPRLHSRAFERMARDEQSTVELVERREGLPRGDPRAAVAVQIVGALAVSTVRELLAGNAGDTFEDLLLRRLAAARSLLSPETERKS